MNHYSGQVEGALRLFGNSIETGSITDNISGSNCDHESYVEHELLYIMAISLVLRINCFLIVTLKRVLMMKLILNVTLVC